MIYNFYAFSVISQFWQTIYATQIGYEHKSAMNCIKQRIFQLFKLIICVVYVRSFIRDFFIHFIEKYRKKFFISFIMFKFLKWNYPWARERERAIFLVCIPMKSTSPAFIFQFYQVKSNVAAIFGVVIYRRKYTFFCLV